MQQQMDVVGISERPIQCHWSLILKWPHELWTRFLALARLSSVPYLAYSQIICGTDSVIGFGWNWNSEMHYYLAIGCLYEQNHEMDFWFVKVYWDVQCFRCRLLEVSVCRLPQVMSSAHWLLWFLQGIK